jgi:hypothetical protein
MLQYIGVQVLNMNGFRKKKRKEGGEPEAALLDSGTFPPICPAVKSHSLAIAYFLLFR